MEGDKKPKGRRHFPYPQGGKPVPRAREEELPEPARGKSWLPENAGHGGEGLSEGYGGAGGRGTGPSGPENHPTTRKNPKR
jgi:hypothetical protein